MNPTDDREMSADELSPTSRAKILARKAEPRAPHAYLGNESAIQRQAPGATPI